MKFHRFVIVGALVIAAAGSIRTRSVTARSPKPDAQRGATIVASGTEYGVVACARCHAFDGAADGSGAFPKLSGISPYYLAKQLRDFASGSRADAIMSAIARRMTSDDIADVSEYYSAVRGTPTAPPAAKPDLLALGTRLATVGDQEKEIQACESCHGPQGRGEGPAIPPLAGQYGHYVAFQMEMWQKGYRKNDANEQMRNISRRLSPQDIQALGAYFERLPQPDAKKSRQP